jgi:hypothetical protein
MSPGALSVLAASTLPVLAVFGSVFDSSWIRGDSADVFTNDGGYLGHTSPLSLNASRISHLTVLCSITCAVMSFPLRHVCEAVSQLPLRVLSPGFGLCD